MTKFGVEEKYINFILETLDKYFKNARYYIFGSRALGTHQTYSDIDIAIDAGGQIASDILAKVNSEIKNSTFPYEVDLIDLNSISDDFRNIISGTLKSIKS